MFKKFTTLLLIGSIALSFVFVSCGGNENDKKLKQMEAAIVKIEKAVKSNDMEAAYAALDEFGTMENTIEVENLTAKQKAKFAELLKKGQEAAAKSN